MPKEDEWVRAVATIAMLKPILAEYSARLRICERAHGGLIRSRAEQFHLGARVIHNHDIPNECGARSKLKSRWQPNLA